MRISSSQVSMNAGRVFSREQESSEKLRVWVGDEPPESSTTAANARPSAALASEARRLAGGTAGIVAASTKAFVSHAAASQQSAPLSDEDVLDMSLEDRLKVVLIESMIEALTGKKVDIKIPRLGGKAGGNAPEPAQQAQSTQSQPAKQGWGLEYARRDKVTEQETTAFSAEGVIKTADGKEINFKTNLVMSRRFVEENNISIRAGDAVKKDPLVINFGGTAAQLSGSTSDFDIDADGVADQVHLLQPGSGFLALDVNGDEKITDGSELFGPSTGNGFIELSRYDTDGNGWIDEADPVFKNLLIWSRDLNGNDQVARLSDKNVGAIYTGKTETPFAMKDGSNTLVGEVVSTGVYLDESGKAGTVQQINLTA